MFASLCLCLRKVAPLLGCAILLSLAASVHADPKPLSKAEQAKVDKAIDKAVAYLKRIQRDKGDWPAHYPFGRLAQTLLPAYALLEAAVPANDPAIRKAADYLRHELAKCLQTDYVRDYVRESGRRGRQADIAFFVYPETYQLSLAVLFFDRLGDPQDEKLIQSLALRLVAGQRRTGGWSYRCPQLTEEDEETLLKLLGELNKRLESGEKPTAKLLKDLNVPRSLRLLTLFQDRRRLTWREPHVDAGTAKGERLDSGPADNSNTQFAMLALWVAQRHGLPLRPTFDLLAERFERTQLANGWWPYAWGRGPTRSMICVGLLGLAIGRGLKLVPKTSPRQAEDVRVLKGLAALYGEIGIPTGQMEKPVPYTADVYFLWSLERVGMLYDLPTLGDKEWYRWGAEILVTNQKPDGHWDGAKWDPKDSKTMQASYFPPLNTAFALLFLKRSHPMKDLTPKLPFTAKELNQGIARLLPSQGTLERPLTAPSRSRDPDR